MKTALASALGVLLTAAVLAEPCAPSSTALCLAGGRFEAKVSWTDFQGNTGDGHAIPLTPDTGYFWFFTNTNVELVVKVLDGRALNNHFWVFYGALSNVQYRMTVRDSVTGAVQTYDNESGEFGSVGDTSAFLPSGKVAAAARRAPLLLPVGPPVDETRATPSTKHPDAACTAGDTSLCLNGGRFRVEAVWKDFQGNTGVGHAVGLTGDTGYFWFFSSTNVEAVVKVLDGRALNDYFWVFYGALSNVEYTLTVTDTVTGIVKKYSNPSSFFASVGDTSAFGTPTTFQLIDGAVVKGEIDAETALVYKVYAFFGDPRLPAAYVGTHPGEQDHGILRQVANRWSTLSPATQQLLQAYLAPPTYPGSWFDGISPASASQRKTASVWTKIPSTHAIVWYRAADAEAETAANNLAAEVDKVWNTETLLFKEPLSDTPYANNGGDGRMDIYVLPGFRDEIAGVKTGDALGIEVPYLGAQPTAAYILIRASFAATKEGARDVLAHEFFHTISAAYALHDSPDTYEWLDEATATWMEDFVYPVTIDNLEQLYAPQYFTAAYKESLDNPSDNGYAEYLFFFYLARQYVPTANPAIWNLVGTKASWDAVDSAIPGGLIARWPEFAIDCWDTPNVDNFKTWDELTPGLLAANATPQIVPLGDDGSAKLTGRYLQHMAMSYAYFHTDRDNIKRVGIEVQKLVQDSAYAKVQAWIKLADGTSRVEDWTKKDRVVFCRDKASEKITDLLILYSNSTPDPEKNFLIWNEGKLTYDSIGCGYQGTVHITSTQSNSFSVEKIDVTATFVHVPEGDFGSSVLYAAARYTVKYKLTETSNGCTTTLGPLEQTFDVNGGASFITFDTSTSPPGYSATCGFFMSGTETTVCQSGTTQSMGAAGGPWWLMPAGLFQEKPDGSLSGTYADTDRTYTWSFTPDTGDEQSQ